MRKRQPLKIIRVAFSLFELLVVIAIIAVLASLLLPAVGVVRAAARSTTCMMHIRQLQVAVDLYAQNTNGKLVLAKIGFGIEKQWETLLAEQVPDILGGDKALAQSVVGTTSTRKNVVRGCPEFRMASNPSAGPALQWTSGYGFNVRPLLQPKTWQTFYKYNWLWAGSGTEMKFVQIQDQAARIAFGDADDWWINGLGAGGNWGSVTQPRMWEDSGNRSSGFIKAGQEGCRRHRGKGIYVFFDGHAEKLDSAHALDRVLDPANQMGWNLL